MSSTTYDCSANPYGMVFNNGNLYVAISSNPSNNITNGIIEVFPTLGDMYIINLEDTPWSDNPSSNPVYGGSIDINPTGLAFDSSGYLYICTPVVSWGSNNSGVISKYDLDNSANSVYNFISYGSVPPANSFNNPFQITCYNDILYWTNLIDFTNEICFFNLISTSSIPVEPSGNILQNFPYDVSNNGSYPNTYITNDNNGNLYLTLYNSNNYQIGVLNIDSSNTTLYNISTTPIFGITYLSGYLYYNSSYYDTFYNTHQSYFYYSSVTDLSNNQIWQNNIPSNYTGGWATNENNELYVAQQTTYLNTSLLPQIDVIQLNTYPPPTPTPTPTPPPTPTPTPIPPYSYDCSLNPFGMDFDKNGNLYVAISSNISSTTITNGIIQVLSNSGNISTIQLNETPWLDDPSNNSTYQGNITINPTGVTFDSNNNMYICTPKTYWNVYNNGLISKYVLDNTSSSVYNFIYTGENFKNPYQITCYNDVLYWTNYYFYASNQICFFNLLSNTVEISGNSLTGYWNLNSNYDNGYYSYITNDNNGNLYISLLNGSNYQIGKIDIANSNSTTPSVTYFNISTSPIYGITYLSGYIYYSIVYKNSSNELETDFYYSSVSNIGEGYQKLWKTIFPSNFNGGWSSNGYNQLYVAQQTTSLDTSLTPLINVIQITSNPPPSTIVYPPTKVILRKNGTLTFNNSITENVLYYYQLNKNTINEKSLDNLKGPITSPYKLNLQNGFIYYLYLYAYKSSTNIYSSPAISNFVSTEISNPNIPVGNICFKKGTKIKTDQGEIEIDKINIKKHTIYQQPILAITKNILTDNFMIRIKKNAFGKNIPSDDIVLSKEHKIYVNGKLFSPGNLVNYKNIFKENYDNEIVYNILMKNHHLIFVNSLLCETLHPKNKLAKLYLKKNSSIIENLNQFIEENNYEEYNKSLKLL